MTEQTASTRHAPPTEALTTQSGPRPVRWPMRAGLFALALLGAACGASGAPTAAVGPADGGAIAVTGIDSGSPTDPDAAAPADAGSDGAGSDGAGSDGAGVDASVGSTALGNVLVGDGGRALYAFTNDTQAASTCYGTCADDWPPVIVDPNWTVGPQLDSGIFATTVRDDGQHQLVVGKWPLYYYAGDDGPGDTAGHGLGDVWFLVDPSGTMLEAPTPADEDGADTEQVGTPEGY